MSKRRRPRRDPMSLAYGIWHIDNNREVIFSRDYKPLWMRQGGRRTVHKCRGTERVPYIKQTHFHIGGIVTKAMADLLRKTEKDFVFGWPTSFLLNRLAREIPARHRYGDYGGAAKATVMPVTSLLQAAGNTLVPTRPTLVVNNDIPRTSNSKKEEAVR
jgi:hypothetical protein